MRAWAVMLGGLGIWVVHFLAVYGLASLADLSPERMLVWRSLAVVATVICLACIAVVLVFVRAPGGQEGVAPLAYGAGRLGAVVAAIAVVWQFVPWIMSG